MKLMGSGKGNPLMYGKKILKKLVSAEQVRDRQ